MGIASQMIVLPVFILAATRSYLLADARTQQRTARELRPSSVGRKTLPHLRRESMGSPSRSESRDDRLSVLNPSAKRPAKMRTWWSKRRQKLHKTPSSLLQATSKSSSEGVKDKLIRTKSGLRRGGLEFGVPPSSSADLDVPAIQVFGAPISGCLNRLGQSSIIASTTTCRQLGGILKNASAAETDVGPCLLDWCTDGLFSVYPPGTCTDKAGQFTLEMNKGDCLDAQFGVPGTHHGPLSEMIDCTVDLCYNLGAYAIRPAGSCNQLAVLRHTRAQDCRAMYGNVDEDMEGDKWADRCEMDICRTEITFDLEVDTRKVPEAATQQGAQYAFKVLGQWQKPKELCTSAKEGETVRLTVHLPSWPERLVIRANGADTWGYKEIRILYHGAFVRVLSDVVSMGMRNDNPSEFSNYWVGSRGPSPTMIEYPVPDVTHLWRSYGTETSCRLDEDDLSEDGDGSVRIKTANTHAECKLECEEDGDCYGVEYEKDLRRCELWFRQIKHTTTSPGNECFVYWNDPKIANKPVIEPEPFYKMLKAEGGRCMDSAPDISKAFVHQCTTSLTQQWHLEDGVLFARKEPYRCLVFDGGEVKMKACDISGASLFNNADANQTLATNGTSTTNKTMTTNVSLARNGTAATGDPITPATPNSTGAPVDRPITGLKWRELVSVSPMSNWSWDGRRFRHGPSMCLSANVVDWFVTLEPCDNDRIEQDWNWIVNPAWKKKIQDM